MISQNINDTIHLPFSRYYNMRTLILALSLLLFFGCKKSEPFTRITGCVAFSSVTISLQDSLRINNCSDSVIVSITDQNRGVTVSLSPMESGYMSFDKVGSYNLHYYYDKARPAHVSGRYLIEVQ